jgi:hypothetical protein
MEKTTEIQARLEQFENRRRFPRLKMQLPVAVTGPDGRKIKGSIRNISPGGAQISYAPTKGKIILQPDASALDTAKSGLYTLNFDLSYEDAVARVRIGAYPVYTQSAKEDEQVCGMIFSEKKLSENKKISDFLFYQLQVSFTDLEYAKDVDPEAEDEAEDLIERTLVERARMDDASDKVAGISEELNALIVQLGHPSTHLDAIKQLLINILSILKANQEISRHINERIHHILQKLSKIG